MECFTCGSLLSSDMHHQCDGVVLDPTVLMEAYTMEYLVVVRLSIKQLAEEVNYRIKEGWIPFGSLAVDGTERNVEYLQPMVKYDTISSTYEGKPTEENIFATTGLKDNKFTTP